MITYELGGIGKGGLGKIFELPSHLYSSYRKYPQVEVKEEVAYVV